MKKTIVPFLFTLFLIHMALFVCHANESPYLWAVDLIIAAVSLILMVSLTLPVIITIKSQEEPPKAPYTDLSIQDLLKRLQRITDEEKAIETELEMRYPERYIRRA